MLRLASVWLLLFLIAAPSAAGESPAWQDPPAAATQQVDARFESPRAAVFTFQGAMRAAGGGDLGAWQTAVDCLDLAQVAFERDSIGARGLARDLWGALNRIRVVSEADFAGLAPGQTSFVFFPRPNSTGDRAIVAAAGGDPGRIVLARGDDGTWRFSAATVAGISDLYAALAPLERKVEGDETALRTESWVRDYVPGVLTAGALLGFEYWQWLGLVLLLFLAVLVDHTVRAFARTFMRRLLGRIHEQADADEVRRTARPVGLVAGSIVWLALLGLLDFRGGAHDMLGAAGRVVLVLAATWAAWVLVDLAGGVLQQRASRTAGRFDDVLIPLLRKTAKLFILALGIVYGAQSLRIDIVPLVTGLGIGGLAFAFAAKDTIENLFGSIAVILDRPFEVGDWVVIGDVEGTVEELGFRSTRVRTFYNSQVTLPNAGLVRATVDNYGRRSFRRWRTLVGVQYDTTPDQLLAFTEGIRELVREHPYTRKDYFQVWVNGFGPSSIDILVYVFHQVPDWSTELRERERLIVDIVRLADHLGVQFAFPTQTLHVFQEEHGRPEVSHPIPGAASDPDSLARGARTARELVAQQAWQRERPGPVDFVDPAAGKGGDE